MGYCGMQRGALLSKGNFACYGHDGAIVAITSDNRRIAVSTDLDSEASEHALVPKVYQGDQGACLACPAEAQHCGIERPARRSIQRGEPADLPGVPRRGIGFGLRELRKHERAQVGSIAADRAKRTHHLSASQKCAVESPRMIEFIAFETIDDIQFPAQAIDEYAFSKFQYPSS